MSSSGGNNTPPNNNNTNKYNYYSFTPLLSRPPTNSQTTTFSPNLDNEPTYAGVASNKMTRLFNLFGLVNSSRCMNRNQIESMIHMIAQGATIVWKINQQTGYVTYKSVDEAELAQQYDSETLRIVQYNHVKHTSSFYSVILSTIPEPYSVADVCHFLNAIKGNPRTHFSTC